MVKALLPFAALLLLFARPVLATPPYAVVAYASTSNEASATNINAGAGPGINWTTDVPWNDITVVVDAFLTPNSDDTFGGGGNKGAALITPAHANGVRCIVALSAGNLSTLCLPGNTGPFASAVTAMMMQYGYDGVEIDWEQTGVASQANATAMMQAVYTDIKALPNSTVDGKPRTLSFTTNPSYSNIYNMTTLGSYTDWCFFMGYDWYDYPPNVNGPLNGINPSIAGSIDSETNGSQWSYPISKMIMGCPLYTNDYQAGDYYDTLSILHLGTAGAYSTSYAEQSYTAPNGDNVYVDTAQSFCDKTNWALTNGLKGIGLWDIGQALPYTDSAVAPIWNTIGGQAACLNLGPTSTPTKTPTPVVASSWRVVAGGPAHTDCNGNVWAADENYTGGTAATSTNTITGALPCSTDQALYQDQRYGPSFSYVFNVPAGAYQVTLKFAETYWTAAGDRVFNVSINGTTELTNFDIYATAGGQNIAVDKVFNNIAPSGGTITITFGPASADNAMVSSLQIIPQPATATPTATFSKTPSSTFTRTASATPTLTFTSTVTNTFSPTVTKTSTSTASNTFTASLTATATISSTPTTSPTGTASPTTTNTPLTPVDTNSPTGTSTSSPTAIFTSTETSTSSSTASYTFSATPTLTPSATGTASLTNTGTASPTFTKTATNTATNTLSIPASTKTYTLTPSVTATNTPTSTGTATAIATNTFTLTASPTSSPTGTMTNTNTPTAKIPTATYTFTQTPSSTPTRTPTTSPTVTTASGCSGIPNWNGDFVAYSVGQKVDYNGEVYQCIQAHTSEPAWEPPVVPALWKDLGPCGSTATTAPGSAVVYPNPVTSSTANIQLPVANAANVKVQVFTVAMRQVQSTTIPQVWGNLLSVQMVDKSGTSLANGLYYFIIQADGQKWMTKVLILR